MQPDPYFFGHAFATGSSRRPGNYGPCCIRRALNPGDESIVGSMMPFLAGEPFLEPQSGTLLHTALLPAYGSENYGLFDGNVFRIAAVLRRINGRFPSHALLAARLADAMFLAGEPPQGWFLILRAAILANDERRISLPSVVLKRFRSPSMTSNSICCCSRIISVRQRRWRSKSSGWSCWSSTANQSSGRSC